MNTRRLEIIVMISNGLSMKEIQSRTGIALQNVYKHRSNFLKEIDGKSDACITRWALKNKLTK